MIDDFIFHLILVGSPSCYLDLHLNNLHIPWCFALDKKWAVTQRLQQLEKMIQYAGICQRNWAKVKINWNDNIQGFSDAQTSWQKSP